MEEDGEGAEISRRVPGEEAARRLMDAAEALLRELPFTQVSTRKIAEAAGINPSAIPRNFGDLEGLFIAVIDRLSFRFIERLSVEPAISDLYNEDFVLRTRLVAWLLGNGTDPEKIGHIVERRGSLSPQAWRLPDGISHKTARVYHGMITLLIEGTTIFFETHAFEPPDILDAFLLLEQIRNSLPEFEDRLGWSDPDGATDPTRSGEQP